MTVRETFGIGSSVIQSADFIAGVELEIEAVRYPAAMGWTVDTDGSLRNEGREFISPPLKLENLVEGFKEVQKGTVFHDKYDPFSERTSIHVHVNCLDQTEVEVKSIVMWYTLFEPVFFAMCKPARRHNIHCVALDQTTLSENYKRSLPLFVQKWSKYTALNLLPLSTQGTIEFRHMHGHNDAELFEQWLKTIRNLWVYGKENPPTRYTLEPENVMKAFDFIFKDSPMLGIRNSVPELTLNNLIDVKLAFN